MTAAQVRRRVAALRKTGKWLEQQTWKQHARIKALADELVENDNEGGILLDADVDAILLQRIGRWREKIVKAAGAMHPFEIYSLAHAIDSEVGDE